MTVAAMTFERRRLLLIGIAFIAFISLGLPDGLLGVAWPSIRGFFDLPLDALGPLLITFTGGYLLSSSLSGRTLNLMGVGTLLALSCLATSVSLIGYALTPLWGVMVALGFLSGLGAGAIDAGLNTYVATHFSARTLNWLHACYGAGATGGPLIMTSVLNAGGPWQRGYLIVGGAQLVLALCFAFSRRLWHNPSSAQPASDAPPERSASAGSTLRLPLVWLSIVLFFVYTGVEVTAGQWAFSLFTESRGISVALAGIWISIYWGSLTVGRLGFGVLVSFAPLRLLLRLCMVLIAVGAALVWLNLSEWLSFLGLALMGLTLAPIFPSMIASTPGRLGAAHTPNAVGFQVSAAVLGGSLMPALVGVLAGRLGLEVVGPALFVAALLLLVLYEIIEGAQ